MAREYNPMSLRERRYLVTGASSGIGRAIAVVLSRLGASVICAGRNETHLAETLRTLEDSGNIAEVFDLRRSEETPSWLAHVASRHGPLNGIVHAAGVSSMVPLDLENSAAVRDVMAINAEAALALARGFRSKRVYAGDLGAIVFISSVLGLVGAPATSAYAMSKGALHALARSLAAEMAKERIRVNVVAPAMVRTPMFETMSSHWSDRQLATVEGMHPLGFGQPDDVAHATAFLLSEASQWITGTVLVVDGGYTAV